MNHGFVPDRRSYQEDGLIVVGAHAPEFSFEHEVDNVRRAMAERGIEYPVALDNHSRFGGSSTTITGLLCTSSTRMGSSVTSTSEKIVTTSRRRSSRTYLESRESPCRSLDLGLKRRQTGII
jgi:hypothetical protein